MDGKNNTKNSEMNELVASLADVVKAAREQGWRIEAVKVAKITDEDIVDDDDTPWGQVDALLDACEKDSDDSRFDGDDICMAVNVAAIATTVEIMGSALEVLENPCSGDDEFDAKVKTAAGVIGSTLDMVYGLCDEARKAFFDGGEE